MKLSPGKFMSPVKNLLPIIILLTVVTIPVTVQAREVAGVKIAENVSVAGQALTLNGAGIRRKFFFKIYVGALYLKKPISSATQVLNDPDPKRIHMYFLYDEVSSKKLTDGWQEGFENNLSEAEMKSLQPKLTKFNNLFTDMVKGDSIDFDFVPASGVSVTIKGQLKGNISGKDFTRALLSVWLGKEPADSSLKQAMLGVEEQD